MVGKIRILIVEDMEIFAKHVQLRLESMGYAIAGIVDNGPDAIKRVHEGEIDIILMDITLEGEMNGIDAAREIIRSSRTPIIFLTANTDKSILESGKELSSSEVFLKPFSEQELHVAIQQAIISNAMNRYTD